jgi:hypothetical protein
MAVLLRPPPTSSDASRPSRLYLWIWGVLLVVLGAGSLIINPDFSTGADVHAEHLFGMFETNGWHGLAGLLAGLAAVAFAPSSRWSPTVAAAVGGAGGVLPSLLFFAVGDDNIALAAIPVDFPDAITLHLIPGLIGLACAYATVLRRREGPPRRPVTP